MFHSFSSSTSSSSAWFQFAAGVFVASSTFFTAKLLSKKTKTQCEGSLNNQQQSNSTTPSLPVNPSLLPSPSSLPIFPDDTPAFLHTLAKNPDYVYRDIHKIYDVTNHLIFSSLIGEKRVEQFYYFSQRLKHEINNQKLVESISKSKLEDSNTDTSKNTPIQSSSSSSSSSSPSFSSSSSSESVVAFTSDSEDEDHPEVRAVFKLGSNLCGHKGIIHGGFSAAVMDELCGAATYSAFGGGNFTANLNIDYIKPLLADRWVLVRSKVVKVSGRKAYVSCVIEDGNDNVYVKAQALFIRPKLPPSVLISSIQ